MSLFFSDDLDEELSDYDFDTSDDDDYNEIKSNHEDNVVYGYHNQYNNNNNNNTHDYTTINDEMNQSTVLLVTKNMTQGCTAFMHDCSSHCLPTITDNINNTIDLCLHNNNNNSNNNYSNRNDNNDTSSNDND